MQDRLAVAGVRPSAYQSKLARALNLDPNSTEPAPKRKGPAGEVILAYLRQQVQDLKDQDPRVRQDAHDAVHKMRVATRRMRSALATYRKLLNDAESVGFLRNELKWLAGVLGQARDAEVVHARLKDMVAEEPGELVMGPVTRRVDLELGGAYQEAHAKALEALDGRRYFRLLDLLEAMIADPPLAPLASKPAVKVMPRLIQRDIKRLRTAAREARRHPAGASDHPALHEARKDGKRLRYAADAAAPVKPQRPHDWPTQPTASRKSSETIRDSVVTRELLRDSAPSVRPGRERVTTDTARAGRSAALEAEARFHREWKNPPPSR